VRRLLSILPVSLVVLVLTAVPALAAEEEQYSGTFAGLAYAGIAGIVLGVVYFLALPKGPETDGHDDHH
jgi:putative cell wall-binding protein